MGDTVILVEHETYKERFRYVKGDGMVCGRKVLQWKNADGQSDGEDDVKVFSAMGYVSACWISDRMTPVFVLPKLQGMSFSAMYRDCMVHVNDPLYGRWFAEKLAWFDIEKPGIPISSFERVRSFLKEFMMFAMLDFVAKAKACENRDPGFLGRLSVNRKAVVGRACRDILMKSSELGLEVPPDECEDIVGIFRDVAGMEGSMEKDIRRELKSACGSKDVVVSAAGGVSYGFDCLLTGFVPVMAIDSSRLFELYVFHKLHPHREGFGREDIVFQPDIPMPFGEGGPKHWYPDFLWLSSRLIIDVKYKRLKSGYPSQDDIRQLAGYGRSSRVHELLDVLEGQEPRILFVYPAFDGVEDIGADVISQSEKLEGFTQMYTLKLRVPRTEY